MAAQRFLRLFGIQIPVAQAVEAVSQGCRIVQGACQCQGPLVIVPALCIVTSRPQQAQVEQRLPLCVAIGSLVGQPKRGLLISACVLEFSQSFVGQPTRTIQADRRRERQLTCGIERPREVKSGGLWGIEGLRLFSGTLAIRQRLLPGSRFRKMGGEICQVRLERRGVETLEGLGNRAVQGIAFADQQLCRDGLPRQGVPEGKLLSRLLDDELGRDQLLEERQELRFVLLGEGLQESKIEVPSGHGCQVQHLPGSFTQTTGAKLDGILDAAWDVPLAQLLALPVSLLVNNVSGLDERFEQFLDEKGIALSKRVHGIQQFALQEGRHREHRATQSEDRIQHGTHLTPAEGGEGEFLGETFTVQVGQEMAQAGVNLVAAVGQQDKQGGGSTAPRQVMEKVQAGLVTPMQVLHDQQRRLFGGLAEEEMSQGGEKTTFLVLRIKRGQRGEIRRQREQIQKRSVGTGTVRWETLALQKKEALSSRVGLRLGHQARFADPRFAGKQNKLPLAAPRSINEQAQCRELGSAANQDRAKDWGTQERLHSVCHLLIECSKSRVLLPPLRRGREGFSSQVVVSFSDATFVFRYQRSHLPALHSAALFAGSYAPTACEWSAD